MEDIHRPHTFMGIQKPISDFSLLSVTFRFSFRIDFRTLILEMLSRSVRSIISRSAKSVDRSHLAGVVPKTHENREDSIKLGGKLAVRLMKTIKTI